MRLEGLFPRQAEKSAASSRWFHILAFPTRPQGFHLELAENGPRHITKRHQRKYGLMVEKLRQEKEGTPGYHESPKVNLHPFLDPTRPDTIFYNATPTMYSDFLALSDKKSLPRSLHEQIRLSGVQIVWVTTEKDGSHKAVFEERSENSGIYPGFGGTIGGSIDGILELAGVLREKVILKDASPNRILEQGLTEAEEELGIPRSVLDVIKQSYMSGGNNLVFMGFAEDKKRKYFDGLWKGTLPYDQKELQTLYETHKANGNDHAHDPMPKRLFFIDDTPEGYQHLLTSLAPLTPMTQAPLLLSGYMARMNQIFSATSELPLAIHAANEWRLITEQGMQKKDAMLDKRAKETRHTLARTERRKMMKALRQVLVTSPKKRPEAFYTLKENATTWWYGSRRRPKGLSTILTPEAQGLPKIDDIFKAKT